MKLATQAWVPRNADPSEPTQILPVRSREFPHVKPANGGGLWTSTWHPEHGSEWVQWCLSEEFDCDRANPVFRIWTIEPSPGARIYEIDTYADLKRLVAAYPHTDHHRSWPSAHPHWQHVASDYDAIHLTDAGQWATRLTHPLNLYGWDCESTLWLRPAFASWTDQGEMRCVVADPWWDEATA